MRKYRGPFRDGVAGHSNRFCQNENQLPSFGICRIMLNNNGNE